MSGRSRLIYQDLFIYLFLVLQIQGTHTQESRD